MACPTPAKPPIVLLILLILIAPARGSISRRMLEKTPPSPQGVTKSSAQNAGDDTVKETRENVEANRAQNNHNEKVHGDSSGLGERKNWFPFPNLPFAPPIPPYLLPPPMPGLPFAPPFQMPPMPGLPFAPPFQMPPMPGLPFTPPFQMPPMPGVPSWPQFPLPPLRIPPFPFVYPPPT